MRLHTFADTALVEETSLQTSSKLTLSNPTCTHRVQERHTDYSTNTEERKVHGKSNVAFGAVQYLAQDRLRQLGYSLPAPA